MHFDEKNIILGYHYGQAFNLKQAVKESPKEYMMFKLSKLRQNLRRQSLGSSKSMRNH